MGVPYVRVLPGLNASGAQVPINVTAGGANPVFTSDDPRLSVTTDLVARAWGVDPAGNNAAEQVIWTPGAANPGLAWQGWLTQADQVRVVLAANNNDLNKTVLVTGLRETTWAEESELLTILGTNPSALTSHRYHRIQSARMASALAYGGSNTNDIEIKTAAGLGLWTIPAGFGLTRQAVYTVPAGYRACVRRIVVSCDSTARANVYLYSRANADAIVAPISPAICEDGWLSIQGIEDLPVQSLPLFAAKTDIWLQAQASALTPVISGRLDIILIPV